MDFMEKALKDAEELEPIAESIYQAVKNLDDVQISIILGPVIDKWASNHNKSPEETFRILEQLAEVQKLVYEIEGPYPK